MPPNWRHHTNVALGKQLTYHSIPVSSTSDEYSVVSSLLDCVQVKSVEQVVLANSKGFTPPLEVVHVPYDHNMSILFHCTANERNVESILAEGLDEKLGNQSGYLGRGFYFADNPMKSMCYDGCDIILVFAVLLGDCLLTDQQTAQYSVREPMKMDIQKRHLNDLFFDSIAARPGNDNEFVIYNRYQCLPLYKVRYENSGTSDRNDQGGRKFDCDEYVQARKDLPEFCWKPNDKYEHPMPSLIHLQNSSWPFDADKIFEKMAGNLKSSYRKRHLDDEEEDEEKVEKSTLKIMYDTDSDTDSSNGVDQKAKKPKADPDMVNEQQEDEPYHEHLLSELEALVIERDELSSEEDELQMKLDSVKKRKRDIDAQIALKRLKRGENSKKPSSGDTSPLECPSAATAEDEK
ncbi:hypothetical protein HA402_013340 [Bradysia odoriphaga]|nr:hypothetical protein HA402_013340 [Bradysia odoriphaga]